MNNPKYPLELFLCVTNITFRTMVVVGALPGMDPICLELPRFIDC